MQTENIQQNRRKQTKAQRRRRRRIKRVAWRVTLSVLTVIGLVLIGALCAGYAAFRGPSQTVGDLLTVSMQETSALKFVPPHLLQQRRGGRDTGAQLRLRRGQ